MKNARYLSLIALVLTAGAAIAQAPAKPLNLAVPPTDIPVAASTAATPAKDPPGTYYGDKSGPAPIADAEPASHCDDATYNQPQVHGSVSTGVVSSSRYGGGSYQAGTVNVSQAFGSCDHPTGGVSISISGANDNNGRYRGRGW
jgi:hypothetical protein